MVTTFFFLLVMSSGNVITFLGQRHNRYFYLVLVTLQNNNVEYVCVKDAEANLKKNSRKLLQK